MHHPVSKRDAAASGDFKSGCTPYAASTQAQNCLRLSATITLLSYMVCFIYFNTRLNVALSSLVLLVTLVHRNNMTGSMLGLPLFSTHSNIATMKWKMYVSFFSILVEISYIFCRPFFAGDDTFVLSFSPNKSIDFSM